MKKKFMNFIFEKNVKWIDYCIYAIGIIYYLILNYFTQINMLSTNKMMAKVGLNENIINYNHWYMTIAYFLYLTCAMLDTYIYSDNKYKRVMNITIFFLYLLLILVALAKYYESATFLTLLAGSTGVLAAIKGFYRLLKTTRDKGSKINAH